MRSFYIIGLDPSGPTISDRYSSEVLSKSRGKLRGSLDWLAGNGAIDASDIAVFDELRTTRNQLVHELQSFVLGTRQPPHVAKFHKLVSLYRKIEVWWVVNVDIPTNPDFDGQDVSPDEVIPGSLLVLQIMTDVASGKRELLDKYRVLSKK